MKKGREPPSWFYEEPEIPDGCENFMEIFWELSTERQIGMSIGPIPMSKARSICKDLGYDDNDTMVLLTVMKHLDSKYMDWVSKKQEKASKESRSPMGKAPWSKA